MTRTRSLLICILTFGALAVSVTSAQAAGCDTWYGPSGSSSTATTGAWSVATNWSTGAIPLTADDVCITVPGTYTVTLAPFMISEPGYPTYAGDSVNSLTLGAASGTQTLDVDGQASISGSNETVNGTNLFVANSSTINANGTLILDSTAGGTPTPGTQSGGGATISGGPLLNYGHIVTQQEDPSTNPGAGAFFGLYGLTNETGASVKINTGTLTESQANAWVATNDGTITVASGASWLLIPNTFSTASFTNNGSVVNDGSITDNGATWAQSGGAVSGNAVVLQNAATLADSAGAAAFLQNYGSATITGTIPAGQTVTVQGEPYNSGGETYYSSAMSLGGAALVNDGTLVLDADGTGSTSGGAVSLTDGSIQNNGTINAEVQDPSWAVHLQAGLANSHAGTVNVTGGQLIQDSGTATTNDGVVTLGPGAVYLLEEGSSFVNASDGTLSPQLASASSIGTFQLSGPCCNGPGTFTAGGTLMADLTGGFLPTANQEFQLFALTGGKFTGTFATVGNGFTADYANEVASPAFVGAIYRSTPPPPPAVPTVPTVPTVHVGSILGGHGKLTLALSCPAGGAACATLSVTATVTEHLKGGKITAITARKKKAHAQTKHVVIATAGASLAAGATKTLTLTLNATGNALLKKYGKLTTTVTASSGGKTLQTSTVHVQKAVKPKKKK